MNELSEKSSQEYLRRFRMALGALPADLRDDLVLELRSHIEERGIAGPFDPERAFGPPESYAAQFIAEQRLSMAVGAGNAPKLTWSLLSLVQRTATVLFLVCPLTILEVFGACFVVLGALRPFSDRIGLHYRADGAFAGLGWVRGGETTELLGLWAMPLFIGGGLLLLWAAHRALCLVAKRELRHLRRER
jgi:uncharacterized membrane protein